MLLFVYMMLSLAMGLSAIFRHGAIYAGVAGIIAPILCWWAASGLKGSLIVGTGKQKLAGAISAIVFVAVGVGLVLHSGYRVGLFGYEFTGLTWCVVGFIVGWISTKRQHAMA